MIYLLFLVKVLEPDYFQYLSDRPMGDGLFYCYRWLLVTFKRGIVCHMHENSSIHHSFLCFFVLFSLCFFPIEFDYNDVFRLWETVWAARHSVSMHFEEFFALAIMKQFK